MLLHAGVADRRVWASMVEQLTWDGDVVAYDRRGFGETTTPPGAAFRHVDDLAAVLDAHVDGPVLLVGNSMGGELALEAAVELPERIGGLVLVAPGVPGTPASEYPAEADMDPATHRVHGHVVRAERAGELDEVNRYEAWLWLDGPGAEEGRVGGSARELFLDMNGIALRHELPEGAGSADVDAWSRLDELTLPVTLAWGTLDLPDDVALLRRVAGRIPGVQVHELTGVAHLPQLEQPALVATIVREAAAAL